MRGLLRFPGFSSHKRLRGVARKGTASQLESPRLMRAQDAFIGKDLGVSEELAPEIRERVGVRWFPRGGAKEIPAPPPLPGPSLGSGNLGRSLCASSRWRAEATLSGREGGNGFFMLPLPQVPMGTWEWKE